MFKAKIDILFSVWSLEKLSAAHRPKFESSYITPKKYWDNCAKDDRLVTPLASQTSGGVSCFLYLSWKHSSYLEMLSFVLPGAWNSFSRDMKSWNSSHRKKGVFNFHRNKESQNKYKSSSLFISSQGRTAHRHHKPNPHLYQLLQQH